VLDTKGNKVTYFGHSTFSLTTSSGQVALIDPWVMTNPVCPEALKKVSRLDVIFLSHAHTDHMGDLLALAKQHRPQIVAIFETCLWLGVRASRKKSSRWARVARRKSANLRSP
jgi:L-ascorbate metabolism protein UlaG (beta-lactamase superfamily)